MKKIALFFVIASQFIGTLFAEDKVDFPSYVPIHLSPNSWETGEYWKAFKPGVPGYPFPKDFYFAENGNYIRMYPEKAKIFYMTGILQKTIPGHWSIRDFDPERYAKASPAVKQMVDSYINNKYPIPTILYHAAKGSELPTKEAMKKAGDLWMGDGMPEEIIYRLEPVFQYLKDGTIWKGSSMSCTTEDALTKFFKENLIPRLEKELPFCKDQKHKWTRKELRKLCDIYCEEYANNASSRPIAWGMFLSPYYLASRSDVMTVAEKGADDFAGARARGMIRQSGGKKVFYTWRGHEPTEKYAYFKNGARLSCRQDRAEQGLPLPHMWYYLFNPYFKGANYSTIESMTGSLIQNIEGDGNYQLSTLGYIFNKMIDYTERHPDRGVAYTPVALLMDYNHDSGHFSQNGTTYSSANIPFDDADQMNSGLISDLFFTEHRHVKGSKNYSVIASYGELFDILSPNPEKGIDPKIFDGYKVIFAMGGLELDQKYAQVLTNYVKNGGTLVMNIKDLNKFMPLDFLGVSKTGETAKGNMIKNNISGKEFKENTFTYTPLALKNAVALYSCKSSPLITRSKVGRGYAVLIGLDYMLQDETVTAGTWKKWQKKPLLNFTGDFIAHLTAGLTPLEIRIRPEDRGDITWLISKKGDGWTVTLFDYSLEKELSISNARTASISAKYNYQSIPFEIICKAPMKDVMEQYEDRDVNYETINGNIVVKESMKAGDIRVYDFQPHKIVLPPRERFVNYALNKPVKVSSTLKKYTARPAVDGRCDNDDFWQSGANKTGRAFEMPQWLEVDLGDIKTIDHIYVQFHCWDDRSPEVRHFIYKYYIEASEDGKTWQKVIDESNNEDIVNPMGLERWFNPVKARYVKLTVLRNSGFSGAQVVEFQVMGEEKEKFQPERKSIIPKWQVQFPDEIKNVPEKKKKYLTEMTPETVKPGWMPAGKEWKEMNGWVTLYTDNSDEGGAFTKSIYGESVFEAVYDIPPDAIKFVSAIGLGSKSREASVEFKVFVDGNEKFNSGLYRFGMPVLPVIVEVGGAKKLKLAVTDAGDGIANDYAWWGDARFIFK